MKTLDRWLAAIALLAITLYVLACAPAFSPDGRRIVVTSTHTNGVSRVLMFDRKTSEWTLLAERCTEARTAENPLASALWLPGGRNILVQWWRENSMQVMMLPVEERGAARLLDLPDLGDLAGQFVFSPPVAHGRLLIGGKTLRALDLRTGVVTSHPVSMTPGETNEIDVIVHMQQDGAYCVYGGNQDLTIGRLNLASLAVTPVLNLKDIGSVGLFFAAHRGSKRLAVVLDKDGTSVVRIYKAQQVEREIRLDYPEKPVTFGNLAWSADGRILYASTFEGAANDAGRGFMSVHAFPADGAAPRRIPLFSLRIKDQTPLIYQFALSPDCKTLAAFGGVFHGDDAVSRNDAALFLVDLSGPYQRVMKYPMPVWK